jgi:hypothetical protein
MGNHVERAEARSNEAARGCLYLNLVITAACLFDYFVQQRPWALESLAAYILLINGGALLIRHFDLKAACRREIEEARHAAEAEARNEARMRERGLR